MRLVLDLGFSSLVLVVSVVLLPLIGLVIQCQWRRGTARKEEIKRLMILASEEAARAELEASVSYTGAVSVPRGPQCAVCYFPTTRRCARCKAVLYCSGKCQIIHWRQGHKEECHPPAANSELDWKAVPNIKYLNNIGDGGKLSALAAASRSEPVQDDRDCSAEESLLNHNYSIEVDFNAESSSESSEARFSGFSGSSANPDSSDDASTSESVGSNDSAKSDEHVSDGTENDMFKSNSLAEDGEQAKTISPKFATLVDAVDNSAGLIGSKKQSAISSDDRAQGKSTSTSLHNGGMYDGLNVDPSSTSPSFWGSAVDSTELINKHHASASLDSEGIEINNSTGPGLPFSFNSSERSIRGHNLLHDAIPTKKVNSESIVVEKLDMGAAIRSSSLKCRKSGDSGPDCPNGPALPKSVEARPSISLDATMPSTAQMVSLRNDSSALQSFCVSDCRSIGRPLDGSVKLVKAGEAKPTAAIPPQVPNLSTIVNGSLNSVGKIVDQLKGSVMSRQHSLQYNDKGLFPYAIFVKLYTWKDVDLRPCGLINCGNSCYVNAVLQCLAFTPPLTAYFLQGLHSKICQKKDWCFMCEYEALLLKAKQGDSPVSPFGIVSQLQKIGSQLSNGREEDAHEFLRYTIDAMESICLTEAGVKSGYSEADTTLIGLTFGGYLQSKIRCSKCQGKTEQNERMLDLTVEIEGNIKTLEEALHRFTVYETLDGENKYKCSRCGSYEKARKKLTVLEAPNVLTIALKRFQSGKYGKLNKSVRFPQILDLAPYMSGTSDKSPVYRLYGVIVHLDVMNAAFSGHYVCYVKNPQNKWFKIDDSMVIPVDEATVLGVEAYTLMYSRCSPRAPRSIRNKLICTDSKHRAIYPRTLSKLAPPNSKPSSGEPFPSSVSTDGLTSMESFYAKYSQFKKLFEEDASSSDNSSLFSSNSDEGSTTDGSDLSDYLFGQSWSSPWRNSPGSETSSSSSSPSSSPLFGGEGSLHFSHSDTTKHSRKLAHSSSRSSSSSSSSVSSSSSSSSRETDSHKLAAANGFDDVKLGVSFRKSAKERTDKTLYL